MKIAVISNLFEPYQRGGAEKIAKIMADTLAENHDVFVVSSKPFVTLDSFKTSMDSYQASFGKEIKVYRYYPLNLFYYLNDFKYPAIIRLFWHIIDVFNWDSANQIAKILEAEKPEIVICHNLKGLGYMLPRKLKKMIIKKTTFDNKKINYLFVGQLETHKGIELILKQFENKNDILQVVGDVTRFNELKTKYNKINIIFHGKMENSKLKELYSQADYVIVPSVCYENSPTVIYEAFNQGIPVIASNIGGIPELVAHNQTGWLFEAGDSISLQKALENSAKTVNYEAMQQNCLKKVREFDIIKYNEKLNNLLKS